MNNQFKKVWSIPLLLASLIVFGLCAALTGNSFLRVLSWIAMAGPLLVLVQKVFVTGSGKHKPSED